MKQDYRRTKTTVSLINYHLFSVQDTEERYFLNQKVEQRFKEIVHEVCTEQEIEILAIECDKDHTHIFFKCSTTNKSISNYGENKRSEFTKTFVKSLSI